MNKKIWNQTIQIQRRLGIYNNPYKKAICLELYWGTQGTKRNLSIENIIKKHNLHPRIAYDLYLIGKKYIEDMDRIKFYAEHKH